MFVLANLEDTIKIEAKDFQDDPASAISRAINIKYANKVLQDVGLCIILHDILTCSEGKVRWGDGCLYYETTFRLVIFRPMIGEVLMGKIHSSTPNGMRVTMGFFDDIYIPAAFIPTPSAFDHADQTWFWVQDPQSEQEQQDPLSVPREDRAYLDNNEPIRFRVESDHFSDPEPGPKKKGDEAEEVVEKPGLAPFVITAGITSSGLGLPVWWNPEDLGGDYAEEE